VVVFVAIGRAAHHPQHSDPAGADESRDQGGGEDQAPGAKVTGVARGGF